MAVAPILLARSFLFPSKEEYVDRGSQSVGTKSVAQSHGGPGAQLPSALQRSSLPFEGRINPENRQWFFSRTSLVARQIANFFLVLHLFGFCSLSGNFPQNREIYRQRCIDGGLAGCLVPTGTGPQQAPPQGGGVLGWSSGRPNQVSLGQFHLKMGVCAEALP